MRVHVEMIVWLIINIAHVILSFQHKPVTKSHSYRTVIEKEMCTYCRKPLGTDTKMILDALQICCHATCFKVRTGLHRLLQNKYACMCVKTVNY